MTSVNSRDALPRLWLLHWWLVSHLSGCFWLFVPKCMDLRTRMHSSRMRTARSSSSHGGSSHPPEQNPPEQAPSRAGTPPEQPPGAGTPRPDPLQLHPWVWAWSRPPSTSPLAVGLDQIPLNFPLGCGPGPDPP